MMLPATGQNNTQRLLLQILLMKAMQDRQAGRAASPQTNKIQELLGKAKQARDIYKTGRDIYDLGSSLFGNGASAADALTPATQTAWNEAAGQASQAAWNAGADAATKAAGQAGTDVTASAGQTALGSALQGAAGLYSMYRGGKMVSDANKIGGVQGRKGGGFGGATAGLGAGMAINALGLALGPVGWAALLGGGLLAGGLAGSRLGDKDKWKTEGKRLGKLLDQGVVIPESLQGARSLQRGRSREELVNRNFANDYTGMTNEGWVNNKFANSRDEKDLRPEDIWGYSTFFEKFGNDWLGKYSEQQRRNIAQAALNRGAVKEGHGTVDINWTPELESEIQQMTNPAPQPQPQQQQRVNYSQQSNRGNSNRIPRARR